MKHLSQDDLVLLHYGESAEAEAAREHLVACARCRGEQAAIERVLGAIELPVPERGPGYEDRVFAAVTARLDRAPRAWWLAPPRLLAVAAALMLAVFAFWLGREHGRAELALSPEQRERVLLLAVSEHLERSERMLRELVNTPPAASLDLGQGPRIAERLVADNRIYRATAQHAGREHLAGLLDELERVLVEIANTPDTVSGPEFNALWRRIQTSGLLIKVRIAETEARRTIQDRAPAPTNQL